MKTNVRLNVRERGLAVEEESERKKREGSYCGRAFVLLQNRRGFSLGWFLFRPGGRSKKEEKKVGFALFF